MKETNRYSFEGMTVGLVVFGIANGVVRFNQYGNEAYLLVNAIVMAIGGIAAGIGFAQKFANRLHFDKAFKWRLFGFIGIIEVFGLVALLYVIITAFIPKGA